MPRQTQFSQGDQVRVTSGQYKDAIGIVRKVHNFGLGRTPFEVDLGSGLVVQYDHGELTSYANTEPAYGHPR